MDEGKQREMDNTEEELRGTDYCVETMHQDLKKYYKL